MDREVTGLLEDACVMFSLLFIGAPEGCDSLHLRVNL